MRDMKEKYRKRINTNKKLHYKNKDLKMQVQKAEKIITSIKSDSIS